MTTFRAAHERVSEEFGLRSDSAFLDLEQPPVSIHVTEAGAEAGDDVPLLFVHGAGFFGAIFAPLMAHLEDWWMLSIDRPGYGLSGDFTYQAEEFRQTAVDVLAGVLDELDVERIDLVGHSAGGY